MGGNSAERDRKVNQAEEARNELAHQVWAQSDQRFVCKCAETTRPIRDQGTVSIKRINLSKPEEYHNECTHQVWNQA